MKEAVNLKYIQKKSNDRSRSDDETVNKERAKKKMGGNGKKSKRINKQTNKPVQSFVSRKRNC